MSAGRYAVDAGAQSDKSSLCTAQRVGGMFTPLASSLPPSIVVSVVSGLDCPTLLYAVMSRGQL